MIGYLATSNNYSYSTALGYESSNSDNHQIMLGTTGETVVIPGNSTIGLSNLNTSTFNAIPNFVNGFKCNGGSTNQIYMGTATYNGSSIPLSPQDTINILYTLDNNQSISGTITGGFINMTAIALICNYHSQLSSNQFYVQYTNSSTTYTYNIPFSIQYIVFV